MLRLKPIHSTLLPPKQKQTTRNRKEKKNRGETGRVHVAVVIRNETPAPFTGRRNSDSAESVLGLILEKVLLRAC